MGKFDEMVGLGTIELTRRPLSTLGEQAKPRETKEDPNSAYRPMPKSAIGTSSQPKPTAAALRTSTPAQHDTE